MRREIVIALLLSGLTACGEQPRASETPSAVPSGSETTGTPSSSPSPQGGVPGASVPSEAPGEGPAAPTGEGGSPPSATPSAGAPSGGSAGTAPVPTDTSAGGAGSSAEPPVGGARAGAAGGDAGAGGAGDPSGARFPFPVDAASSYCTFAGGYDPAIVRDAYEDWKKTVTTPDGAGGYRRVRKPDSGTVIDSTVSEGIGYGMLLAVYMDDQALFDDLWRYEQLHLNGNGLMHWEIDPEGNVIGTGAALDGDEDMAFALVMADRQWGGQGALDDTYLNHAIELIELMWEHEIDHGRDEMPKAGDEWGDVDITNPSYFAPAYYRVFGQVTGKEEEWNRAVATSYDIIERSLNAASGNQNNGLVPAWCTSQGVPTEAYPGAPLHFQQDSTRTPFRVGQDYCWFGEPRAKAYLEKITSFYAEVGVANIGDGYELDGTPRPERAVGGLQTASFVGPAGVGAMNDPENQAFVDEAYAAVATLGLSAGTIYYQKSWTALSLLMLTGNFADLTQL